ncbi:MAG: M56 family metallopeptidase [Chloroflexi bacterium]|nr:M56 family metallopeptidase [Chloroflexota bacterium]
MSGRYRSRADGPLLALLGLSLAFVIAQGWFVARQTLPYAPLVACQTWLATWLARLTNLGVLLPAATIAVSLLAALLALCHQVWVTRRVLRRTLAEVQPAGPRLTRIAAEAGLSGRVDRVSDSAAFTFCHGLWRPRVCISDGLVELLDDAELLAVLDHEAHHGRHRDPLKILLGRSLASGLFFLPLAGALRNAYLAGKELSADAAACRRGGDLPLASALLKMLGAERPVWPAGVLAIGAMSPTEARLRQLVERQPSAPSLPGPMDWVVSAAMAAGILGFGQGAALAARVAPIHGACAPATAVVASPARLPSSSLPAAASTENLGFEPVPSMQDCLHACQRQDWCPR